jgi:hypothetical protein
MRAAKHCVLDPFVLTVDKESAGDALLVRRVLCFIAMPRLKSERSLVELEFISLHLVSHWCLRAIHF